MVFHTLRHENSLTMIWSLISPSWSNLVWKFLNAFRRHLWWFIKNLYNMKYRLSVIQGQFPPGKIKTLLFLPEIISAKAFSKMNLCFMSPYDIFYMWNAQKCCKLSKISLSYWQKSENSIVFPNSSQALRQNVAENPDFSQNHREKWHLWIIRFSCS